MGGKVHWVLAGIGDIARRRVIAELRLTTREGTRLENLPPHPNLHYPVVENLVDAVLANDASRLACPAEQGAWVDWTIEQVARSHAAPA